MKKKKDQWDGWVDVIRKTKALPPPASQVRPHSPDAYALVEKVLRNREVLKVASRVLTFEGFRKTADKRFKLQYQKMVEEESTKLQQLIDSL